MIRRAIGYDDFSLQRWKNKYTIYTNQVKEINFFPTRLVGVYYDENDPLYRINKYKSNLFTFQSFLIIPDPSFINSASKAFKCKLIQKTFIGILNNHNFLEHHNFIMNTRIKVYD